MIALALASFLLLLISFFLLWLGRRTRIQAGLPKGEIIYSDTSAWRKVEKPLTSRRYGLVGKPDYLMQIQEAGHSMTIPIEVKSRKRPKVAYDSHILQLATYAILVEETTQQRPTYGLLRYADATVKIPLDNALRDRVLKTAGAIRQARSAADIQRQHTVPSRCRGCGYRGVCGTEALVN